MPITDKLNDLISDIGILSGQPVSYSESGQTIESKVNYISKLLDNFNGDPSKLDAPTTPGTAGQVLTSDGEGGQVWAGIAAGEVVIDDTLSVQGAAAEAKAVGVLKTALPDVIEAGFYGIRTVDEITNYTYGYKIDTVAVGSTIDINSTSSENGSRKMAYSVFPVSKGDVVYYEGKQASGGTRRPLTLTDSNYKVVQTTISTSGDVKYIYTAKVDGYCIVNTITYTGGADVIYHVYYVHADTYADIKARSAEWTKYQNTQYVNVGGEWEQGEFEGFATDAKAIKTPIMTLAHDTVFTVDEPDKYTITYSYYTSNAGTWTKVGSKETYLRLSAGMTVRVAMWSENNLSPTTDNVHVLMSVPVSPVHTFDYTYSSVAIFGNIGIIGDSYALGSMHWENDGYHGYPEYSWGKLMCKRNGNECALYAHGGYGIKSWNANVLPTLLADDPCNLYWWGIGVNDADDANDSTKRGTIADITSYESYTDYPDTLYGNFGRAIEQVMAHAPLAKHVIVGCIGSTPNHRFASNSYLNINNVLKELAEHYQVPFIDLVDDPFYISAFYMDSIRGNHPTLIGYGGMSFANERLLNQCIVDNITYFVDYGRTNSPEDVDETGTL